MRYYSNPAFKIGAFTNPDPAVRREAIDLTKRGIDAAREAGSKLMTLWLGQDGFDYAFQADYARLWAEEIDGIREVAEHDPDCLISIEYKPNEPRSYSLMPDCATTLLALREVGLPNLGVTLDFAHVLYADEQPAFAAALIGRYSRLLGVHLNDGYAKRDDGLMVGAVHSIQTIELLRQVYADGFDGPIYFDTFPDLTGLDPVRGMRGQHRNREVDVERHPKTRRRQPAQRGDRAAGRRQNPIHRSLSHVWQHAWLTTGNSPARVNLGGNCDDEVYIAVRRDDSRAWPRRRPRS